jgi:hypothetical protein
MRQRGIVAALTDDWEGGDGYKVKGIASGDPTKILSAGADVTEEGQSDLGQPPTREPFSALPIRGRLQRA